MGGGDGKWEVEVGGEGMRWQVGEVEMEVQEGVGGEKRWEVGGVKVRWRWKYSWIKVVEEKTWKIPSRKLEEQLAEGLEEGT